MMFQQRHYCLIQIIQKYMSFKFYQTIKVYQSHNGFNLHGCSESINGTVYYKAVNSDYSIHRFLPGKILPIKRSIIFNSV